MILPFVLGDARTSVESSAEALPSNCDLSPSRIRTHCDGVLLKLLWLDPARSIIFRSSLRWMTLLSAQPGDWVTHELGRPKRASGVFLGYVALGMITRICKKPRRQRQAQVLLRRIARAGSTTCPVCASSSRRSLSIKDWAVPDVSVVGVHLFRIIVAAMSGSKRLMLDATARQCRCRRRSWLESSLL